MENLEHALAPHEVHYNFVRIHRTPRCTPATPADASSRLRTIRDVADLLDRRAIAPGPPSDLGLPAAFGTVPLGARDERLPSFDERLGLLVEAEWLARENKRLRTALREARLRLGQACV